MRRTAVAIVLLLLFVSVISVPFAGDASLIEKDTSSMDQTVVGGNSATYTWFVYNKYNESVFISASVVFDDPSNSVEDYTLMITAHPNPPDSSVVLDSNKSATIELVVNIKHMASKSTVGIDLRLQTDVGVDNQNETDSELVAKLNVTPVYHLSDNYNSIMGVYPNILPEPADGPLGAFLVSMAIWILTAIAFMWVIMPWITRSIIKHKRAFCPQIKNLLNKPFFYLVVSYGFFSSVFILGPDYQAAVYIDSLSRIIYISLFTWIIWELYKLLVHRLMWRFKDDQGLIDESLVPLFIWLGKIVLGVSYFGAILDVFGFDLMVFLAGAGIIGIALAIGAQDTMSNFFAGFFLLLERPFKVGDLIMMDDGVICEVTRVGLRSTTLYNTWSPQYFIMPNRHIADSKITNVLRPDPKYWVKIDVGVAYGSDVGLVKKILMDVVMTHPETMKDEDHLPWSRFMAFGDSSLDFRVTAWVEDFNINYRVASELREAIDKEFRKHGIQIPFPQRDLWFRNSPS